MHFNSVRRGPSYWPWHFRALELFMEILVHHHYMCSRAPSPMESNIKMTFWVFFPWSFIQSPWSLWLSTFSLSYRPMITVMVTSISCIYFLSCWLFVWSRLRFYTFFGENKYCVIVMSLVQKVWPIIYSGFEFNPKWLFTFTLTIRESTFD